ncbi:hypothetical protein Glaag_1830 [Glaciecola sp. 4H-3-7+YE-5]|jgi:hypothetical protein|nr:hypothetical protein Glaag_1830 [Glaciecola sp. 4H-3-7+YE-5]
MDEPVFSTYSIEELEDALKHIDKAAFPDRVEKIHKEIELRQSGVPAKELSELVESKPLESTVKKGKKSARGLVLAIWPATVIFSIYYGELPSRNGLIHYKEEPGLFVTCLLIFIGVGFYFYHGRDDT